MLTVPGHAQLRGKGHMPPWAPQLRGGSSAPGPGHHPRGTASLLILPDVVVLLIIEGLDAVTAAGLEQSCAGLQGQELADHHPGRRAATCWGDSLGAPPSQGQPLAVQQLTHTVLLCVNAEVDLCNPVEWGAAGTNGPISLGSPAPGDMMSSQQPHPWGNIGPDSWRDHRKLSLGT